MIGRALLLGAVALCSCNKVPIVNINAGFALADAAWFAEEQTLFFFYNVSAEQGLGPESQVEVSWRTDDQELTWTPIENLNLVHTHIPVVCGPKTLCGSLSLKVESEPRQVGLRLRYHKDGELVLNSQITFNVVGLGPAFSNRSLTVYGVFDATNQQVQWRARHVFPTVRNEHAQQLGLRRRFHIRDVQYGDVVAPTGNFYGYAFAPTCPAGLTPLPWEPKETLVRAMFDTNKLPLAASTAFGVCAQSIVTDAKGPFEAVALARKNPDVRAAFPVLKSPIKPNIEVGFLLRPCMKDISQVHQTMQVQRLLLSGAPEICIDNYKDPNFPTVVAGRFRTQIELMRATGRDMVLAIALHHDDTKGEVGTMLEKALEQILPVERNKTSPRVSGAFVFDTFKYNIVSPAMRALVLWCPASVDFDDLDKIPSTAQMTCPIQPDFPEINLGPFRFSNLAILPTRPQYLKFLEKYSEAQAGRVTELSFAAPERTPISQNVQAGEFGVVTFFNGELFSAQPTDAFSFCASGDVLPVGVATSNLIVFRSPIFPMPLPLSTLPEFHTLVPSPQYEIGLLWDFPFLTRMNYEIVIAGAATVFSLTVPFGISNPGKAYYGTKLWEASEFPLANTIKQCTRFCDHPTFDPSGTYNVAVPFRTGFKDQCYQPVFPAPPGEDFPLDP